MSYRSRVRDLGLVPAGPLPEGVKWLLITNVAVFLFFYLGGLVGYGRGLFGMLELVPRAVVDFFMVWQLATYLFLHGGFGHIIWNMLTLWWFGVDLERTWGTRRFLKFYFFCGVGAGVCVVILDYLFGNPSSGTIGSSGAIFGILMAYAMLFPDNQVLWAFLIPIKVKYFVAIIGAVTFLMSLSPGESGISEFAHLGGLLFGYLFVRGMRSRRPFAFDVIGPAQRGYRQWKLQRAKRKFQVYMRKKGGDRGPWVN
ncbi:MAG TPA: rhomboid family intramembrane serine protease [Bryobacteraceae bacterium]|nr:rhomboid family intramembrane serine protease [Bryobacteraceae bacterium]